MGRTGEAVHALFRFRESLSQFILANVDYLFAFGEILLCKLKKFSSTACLPGDISLQALRLEKWTFDILGSLAPVFPRIRRGHQGHSANDCTCHQLPPTQQSLSMIVIAKPYTWLTPCPASAHHLKPWRQSYLKPLWIFLPDLSTHLLHNTPRAAMKLTIPFITLLSLLPAFVSGQDDPLACHNCKVDVDDSDPRIVYSPAASWTHQTDAPKVEGDQIYYKATNSYARAEGASATFKFTGVVCPLYSAYHCSIAVSHVHFLGYRILGCSAILWSYNSDRWGNTELGNWPELLDNHRCLARIQYVRRAYNHYNGFHLWYRSFIEYQSWQIPVSAKLRYCYRV